MRHNEMDDISQPDSPVTRGRSAHGRGATPVAIAVMAVLGQALGQAAQADTIEVTTTAQKVGGTGGCSLQEAIWAANLGESQALEVDLADAYGETDRIVVIDTECVIEPDGSDAYTIVLPAGEVFTMTGIVDDPTNYTGPTATPLVFSEVVIEANGATLERAVGAANFRALAVGSALFQEGRRTGSLTLRNAHIRGFAAKGGDGRSGGGGGLGAGGAIYVHAGDLNVEQSTFEANGAMGGNGSRGRWTGGGGGGLGGNGGDAFQGGGGGGGGARGDGGGGDSSCGTPCLGIGAGGGGGGGTVDAGEDGRSDVVDGGYTCGGKGGYVTLNPLDSPQSGQDGRCPGGGGGGGRDSFFGYGEVSGGSGGRGAYGGGGGGGAYRLTAGDGGRGGFGGGGGGAYIFDSNLSGLGPDGGDGGFGGGGGAAAGGYLSGSSGSGGSFAGSASSENGGGGAGLGGAIFNHAGDVRIENSTFTGNYAVRGLAGSWPNDTNANSGRDQGGAIFSVGGSLTVLNSTIAANEGTSSIQGGAGIVVYAPGNDIFADPGTEQTRFTLHNTIIAGNVAGSQVVKECRLINSSSNSVVFEGSGNLITANDNCTAGVVSNADPGLGPLQVNLPGITPTMAIGPASPALDTGDPATALLVDQRGLSRPAGAGYDIGAFEYGAVVAQCADVTVFAGASCTADASIDAGSFSPDSGGITLSQNPPGPFNLGDTAVTLMATSTAGVSASCSAKVTVVDNTPPVVTAVTALTTLSPTTQHNLVDIGLAATATDGCSTPPTTFQVQVFADEDDETPTSVEKGTVFSPDAADIGAGTLRLRAERSDVGDGRVYLVVTSGEDSAGNVGRACSTVVVPFSPAAKNVEAVNAQADAARAACEANGGTPPAGYFVIGDGPERAPRPKR